MSASTTSSPQNKMTAQRVGIFVDVQNMFYSAKNMHQSKIDYRRLMDEITGSRSLVRTIAYMVKKPDVDQSGFEDALSRLGYDLKVKELKIRNDGSSKGDWAVGMTMDIISMVSKLDVVVFVTGDGDFAPLLDYVRNNGCRAEVVSFRGSTATELLERADAYIPIEGDMLFKIKKYEREATEEEGDSSTSSSDAPKKTARKKAPAADASEEEDSLAFRFANFGDGSDGMDFLGEEDE